MMKIRIAISILLIAAIAIGVAGCSRSALTTRAMNATDLMDSISPNSVSGRVADAAFTASMADFSVELFKRSITDGENSLISPLSVMLALAMTANGADGETLAQMEALLGGGIPLAELNEYLYSYAQSFPSIEKSKLSIANSIWFRDDGESLQIHADFLQRNADYFDAAVYSAAFDGQTVRDINNWVSANTDRMIDTILNEISDLDMLFLINAVIFDAEWLNVYHRENVRKGDFTDINGTVRNIDFMHSSEYAYLEDGMATGFIKPYANGAYSFAALLPNEGVPIEEYIESLTGAGLLDTLGSRQDVLVYTSMPKFEFDYSISMIDALEALGIHDAFDEFIANFGSMGMSMIPDYPNLYISEVLHKTFISVDELGTKAGAVTMVSVGAGGSAMPIEPKIVDLDRPFVFAIIDNATNLPVFIGTLMTI